MSVHPKLDSGLHVRQRRSRGLVGLEIGDEAMVETAPGAPVEVFG